jgi:methionyl aminopeptidase
MKYNAAHADGMRIAGKKLAEIFSTTETYITDTIDRGLTKNDINQHIKTEMKRLQCKPLFLGHDAGRGPFPKESIVSLNEEIVHAIPDDTKVTREDLITVDIGIVYNGFCADAARTYTYTDNKEHQLLKQATEEAFFACTQIIKTGVDIYTIGKTIERVANKYNVTIIEELTGHGIGRTMWEPPHIFQVPYEHYILKENKTVCIEPIFSLGSSQIHTMPDNWTLVTEDGSLAAQYEHMILVTKNGCEILTA